MLWWWWSLLRHLFEFRNSRMMSLCLLLECICHRNVIIKHDTHIYTKKALRITELNAFSQRTNRRGKNDEQIQNFSNIVRVRNREILITKHQLLLFSCRNSSIKYFGMEDTLSLDNVNTEHTYSVSILLPSCAQTQTRQRLASHSFDNTIRTCTYTNIQIHSFIRWQIEVKAFCMHKLFHRLNAYNQHKK